MRPRTTYKDAGVDLRAGDDASQIMFRASQKTWKNRSGRVGQVECPNDSFAAVRYMCNTTRRGLIWGLNFDGVGTKIEIAERVGAHASIAFDLLAMVCDDAAIRGAEPVWVGSIIDFNAVSTSVVRQLAQGMIDAAKEADVAVVNGEIAELGERVGGYGRHCYNWGAAALWVAQAGRVVTGASIRVGDAIVGVAEHGFRSNGLSLVRRVFREKYGPNWHRHRLGRTSLGTAVLAPSRIYTRLMVGLTGGAEGTPAAKLSGLCHVTGGGVPGKLRRLLLPTGLGAFLHDPLEPSAAMLYCQKMGRVEDAEAYRAWNMGQGLLIVTREPEEVVRYAVRKGFKARTIGEVTADPTIRIASKGAYSSNGRYLSFSP